MITKRIYHKVKLSDRFFVVEPIKYIGWFLFGKWFLYERKL